MSAGIYKMLCEQGATFNLVLTWRNPDGTPIDLTNYSAEMRVAKSKGGTLVLNPSTANGQIVLGNELGTVMIDVDADTTSELIAGQYVYELDLDSNGGQVTRLVEGPFLIDGKV